MDFPKFDESDFAVFTIDGFEARMNALREQIRPKLEAVGQSLSPFLSQLLEDEVYVHVAKHARRTVNPPDSTWVAFSTNKRGYKGHPHFQIGMWSTHLFAQFALIYEAAEYKQAFARNLKKQSKDVMQQVPATFYWSTDHMQPDVLPHREANATKLKEIAKKLQNVKKTEALCGRLWKRGESQLTQPQQMQSDVEQTFSALLPLYHMSY